MDAPKKIGILGGSFDPIHTGHLLLAQEALWQHRLDSVLFVVTSQPPHKKKPEADAEDRFRMVELAIAAEPRFETSRIEIDRGGDSYTVDTLRELHAVHPGASLYLIVGADSVLDFGTWKKPDAVIENADLIAAVRPGFDLSKADPAIREKTFVLDSPSVEFSSSLIRKRLHEGKPVRFFVPDAVEKYIAGKKLYSKREPDAG